MARATHLFLDIGGVLLTNGWDHNSRKHASVIFKLDWTDLEERHRMAFDVYEQGRLTMKEYLDLVIFYKKRDFSRATFRNFMFSQSQPYEEMLKLMSELRARYGLKIAAVNNEALELNNYRIRKFKLDKFIDTFISSCYINHRKPDSQIYKLALDITYAKPRQVIYIENTPAFVHIAENLGIRSILHTDYKTTRSCLAKLGLNYD
jgi:putative hydrolase of the HAD superfamily